MFDNINNNLQLLIDQIKLEIISDENKSIPVHFIESLIKVINIGRKNYGMEELFSEKTDSSSFPIKKIESFPKKSSTTPLIFEEKTKGEEVDSSEDKKGKALGFLGIKNNPFF